MPRVFKNNFKFFLIGFLVFFVFAFYVFQIFFIKASNNEIKIIPSFYSGDWQNPQAVFSQDLDESAGIEEFNAENSAYPFCIKTRHFALPIGRGIR